MTGGAVCGEIFLDEGFRAAENFLFRDVLDAKRFWKTAVIGAGLVRTGFTFNPFRVWVEGRKPFGKLGAKNGKRGHAAKRRDMSRPGVVADKSAGLIGQGNQLGDRCRYPDAVFSVLFPPIFLVRIAGDLDGVIFFPEMAC